MYCVSRHNSKREVKRSSSSRSPMAKGEQEEAKERSDESKQRNKTNENIQKRSQWSHKQPQLWGMNFPSRNIQLARGRARCAWHDLTGIEGRAHVVRRRGQVNCVTSARLVLRGLNGKWEGREERGAMEAGGEGQGWGKASVAGEINSASWWCSEQHHMWQSCLTQGQSMLKGSCYGSRDRIPSSTLRLPLQHDVMIQTPEGPYFFFSCCWDSLLYVSSESFDSGFELEVIEEQDEMGKSEEVFKTLAIRGTIRSCVGSSVGGRQENSLRTARSNC